MARRPTRSRSARRLASTFALLLTTGSLLLVGLVGTTAAGAEPTARSANARFVVAAYDDLLGRSPDVAGLDHHLSRIAAGGDAAREKLAYSLLFSAEGSRAEVGRAYRSLLDRAPDSAGESYWTEHLQGRGVLDLRVLLLASDEFHLRAGGTDRAWLDAVYQATMGRAADAGGRDYWLGLLDGGVARPLVVAALYLSDESINRRVSAYYDEILDRPPTATERSTAAALLRSEGERRLRARLFASDEKFENYLDQALPR